MCSRRAADVRRVQADCGGRLTGETSTRRGRSSLPTVRNRFGGWEAVLRAAGGGDLAAGESCSPSNAAQGLCTAIRRLAARVWRPSSRYPA